MAAAPAFSYTRLFADADGETHLEDVAVAFEDVGALAFAVASLGGHGGLRLLGGTPTPRSEEPHAVREDQFFFVLRGSGAIGTSDGDSRALGPGSVLLLEDGGSRGHSLRIRGEEMVAAVAVVGASERG